MSDIINPKIKETLENWKGNLKKALKEGINEKTSHLLQCPSQVVANLHSKQIHPNQVFQNWAETCLVSYKGTRYLKLLKETKKRLPFEKPLAIIKSYSDPSKRAKKAEENCLTLLHETQSQHKITSKKGNLVEKWLDRPCIQAEIEIPPAPLLKGPKQEYITPLGKKGILAFHTGHQYCALPTYPNGEFQRFLLAANPHAGLIRVAHTLGRLANADPKSISTATKTLTEKFNKSLQSFGEHILYKLTHETTHLTQWENHIRQINEFEYSLPKTILKKGPYRIILSLCLDNAYGYTFESCALSIKTDNPSTDATHTQESFKAIWAMLQKN